LASEGEVVHGQRFVHETVSNYQRTEALALSSGIALAATITCQVGVDCLGTKNADTLNGTAAEDYIYGRGGADTIFGGEGNDDIHVYDGYTTDTVYCGPGEDTVSFDVGIFGIVRDQIAKDCEHQEAHYD
jgi:Ca2+-binding RTX toxin-like protein